MFTVWVLGAGERPREVASLAEGDLARRLARVTADGHAASGYRVLVVVAEEDRFAWAVDNLGTAYATYQDLTVDDRMQVDRIFGK